MPSNFNKTLASSPAPENSAQPFVNTSGNPMLGVLAPALQAAQVGLDTYNLNKFQNELGGLQDQQDASDTQKRELMLKMKEAADQKDKASELQYQSRYRDIVTAEQQNKISGNHAAILQEKVLKEYINRFPHLETQFRKVGSSVRTRNAAVSMNSTDDPEQAGIEQAMKTSRAEGYTSLTDYWQDKQLEISNKRLASSLATGNNMYQQISKYTNDVLTPNLNNYLYGIVGKAMESPEGVMGDQLSATIKSYGDMYIQQHFYGILDSAIKYAAINPDGTADPAKMQAQLSRENIDGIKKQLDDVVQNVAGLATSQDTLKTLQWANKVKTERTLEEIGQIDPLLSYMIQSHPDSQLVKDLPNKVYEISNMLRSGRTDAVQALRQQAQQAGDATSMFQYEFAMYTINRLGAKDYAANVRNFADGVSPSTPFVGNPHVDAAIAEGSIATASATGDQNLEAATAKGILEQEKQVYPNEGLSSAWYKNPTFRKTLTNKAFKTELDTEVNNAATGIVNDIGERGRTINLNTSILPTTSSPWEQFPQGGPFEVSAAEDKAAKAASSAAKSMPFGGAALAMTPDDLPSKVAKLNDGYWAMYYMYGKTRADNWAKEVLLNIEANIPVE